MEGSKRTTTHIGHLSSSTKNKQNKNRYNFMTESMLSNNTLNRFKFNMNSTRGKTCGRRHRNRTITVHRGKSRTVDNRLI